MVEKVKEMEGGVIWGERREGQSWERETMEEVEKEVEMREVTMEE